MASMRRALLFGLLVWLIPFGVAFLIFPLRQSSRPLFESIMPVAVAAVVAGCGLSYFRHVTTGFVREGLALGILWLVISVAIDAPLMLFGGPMQMTIPQYAADIGLTYLLMPVITGAMGAALARQRKVGCRLTRGWTLTGAP
jgi:hypothetical protein